MYWDEHNPPHFHAEYTEFKAIISINNSTATKGFLPGRQLKLVLAWSEIHNAELLKNWSLAKNKDSLMRIDPLR